MTYKHVTYDTPACRAARALCIERQGDCRDCPHAVPSLGNSCMIRAMPEVVEKLGPAPKRKAAKRGPGEIRPHRRLAEAEVLDILAALERGEKQTDLEARYGLSRGTVAKINKGRIWGSTVKAYREAKRVA